MNTVLHIAFPTAMPQCFDYLTGDYVASEGSRVQVPFKRNSRTGIVIAKAKTSKIATERLKCIEGIIDAEPILEPALLSLLQWVSSYYHYPIGGVLKVALPRLVRQGHALHAPITDIWQVCGNEDQLRSNALKQRALLKHLQKLGSADAALLDIESPDWRGTIKKLEAKGLVRRQIAIQPSVRQSQVTAARHQLNADQQRALAAISKFSNQFSCSLLEGVTGSGKTEVYRSLCEKILSKQAQVLVLVPEIALTLQTVECFRARFGHGVQIFHSGQRDTERLQTWVNALSGEARIVVGTRSAVFLPFKKLGMIIVDEEHDSSYKQEDSLRYHARDVAIKRAKIQNLPILLGSATPSLETLRNVSINRYAHHRLPHRIVQIEPPKFHIIDLRAQSLEGGLSQPLIHRIDKHIQRNEQVLLFINRRGYAPVTICHACGTAVSCPRCDASMVYHQSNAKLNCHHCAKTISLPSHCPSCGAGSLNHSGVGTEQLEEKLHQLFPTANIVRIDRDVTRRKGALEKRLAQVRCGVADIIIGTQMLAKGHHLPSITLACIINIDQGLFATDFRSTERLAQLIVQVSGRAGRGTTAGHIVLQTYHPKHPCLQTLVKQGYAPFARELLSQRETIGLPPYSHFALLRAEARQLGAAMNFLQKVEKHAQKLVQNNSVHVHAPMPATMEKKASYYRASFLLETHDIASLHDCLTRLVPVIQSLPKNRSLRWHLDVDPLEID